MNYNLPGSPKIVSLKNVKYLCFWGEPQKVPEKSTVNNRQYIFTSLRLGFRNWDEEDVDKLADINSDKEVMKFFPSTLTKQESSLFIDKMKKHQQERSFCYFAVDLIGKDQFIGFIGLMEKDFVSSFTPCVDIGWRLNKKFWGQGLAAEGGSRCLDYGFRELSLQKIVSIAPVLNKPSVNVMKRIGMEKLDEFDHPLLLENEKLKRCVLYGQTKEQFQIGRQ